MIRSITVLNRFHADLLVQGMEKPPSDYWYLISIYSWPDPPLIHEWSLKMAQSAGCKNHLSISFGDLTPETLATAKKAYPYAAKHFTLFNKNHAKSIISFANKIQADENEGDLIVHCHAGISRSGAVAMFVHNRTGVEFYDTEIRPNPYITKLLEEVEGVSYTNKAREKRNKDGI